MPEYMTAPCAIHLVRRQRPLANRAPSGQDGALITGK